MAKASVTSAIRAPRLRTKVWEIKGTTPLVVHRFPGKIQEQMKQKMETGKAAASKKTREAKLTDDSYQEARYISQEGWDGFNAAGLRKAMISACRLVGFKMTLAKMSVFVVADGWDKESPQMPLVRIYGDPVKQEDIAKVETGQPYVTVRAAYHGWSAKPQIQWDEDQFTEEDIAHLLMRVGIQVGLCEGRHDSKNSAGMGWGLFEVVTQPD